MNITVTIIFLKFNLTFILIERKNLTIGKEYTLVRITKMSVTSQNHGKKEALGSCIIIIIEGLRLISIFT